MRDITTPQPTPAVDRLALTVADTRDAAAPSLWAAHLGVCVCFDDAGDEG